jgi:glycosyltransferase involved in cell wall biosynthesis
MPCPFSDRNSSGFIPTCTVVICTRNRAEQLERCLAGVFSLAYPRFDVLVVDNAPSDERSRAVAWRWGTRYLLEPVVGLSRARNVGARSCQTEIVAFLDDDAIPDPEWLSRLVNEFEEPRAMVVTGRILPLGIQTKTEHECALMSGSGGHRLVIDRENPRWFELANFGGLGDGGNMAFRRCLFETWPGFDERLGRGTILGECEEHHAFFSLLGRGHRVVYTPHAIVQHPYARNLGELKRRIIKLNIASAAYMTLLWVEEPRFRRRVARYALEALAGVPRPWRTEAKDARSPVSHQLRSLFARLYGPLLYLRSRFERPSVPPPQNPVYHDRTEKPYTCLKEAYPLAVSLVVGASHSPE